MSQTLTLIQPGEAPQTPQHALQPLYASSIAFLIIDTLIVVLRFFTVLKLRRPRLALTWDDWLLVPAYLCVLANCICGLVMYHLETANSTEGHQIIVAPSALVPLLKLIFVVPIFTLYTYAFTRLSILALFLRLFTRRWTRWASYFLICFVVLQTIAYFVAVLTLCSPTDYFWERGSAAGELGELPGTCQDQDTLYRAITPPNIVTDVLLIILPLPEVWSLRSSRARRAGLTVLFLTGCAALVASCFRLEAFESHSAKYVVPTVTNDLITWLVVEPSIYLVAACLLAMHPLFRLMLPARWAGGRARTGAAARQDFARLMDGEGGRTALVTGGPRLPAKPSRDSVSSGPTAFDAAMQEVEMMPKGSSPGTPRSGPSDQALRAVSDGMGVLVRTEVIVTAEERIEAVLNM